MTARSDVINERPYLIYFYVLAMFTKMILKWTSGVPNTEKVRFGIVNNSSAVEQCII